MTIAPDTAVADACSFLFVPGNRPDRFDSALRSGADAVVIDLEDAVPPAAKPGAREAVAGAWQGLAASGVPLVLRVNADGDALQADLLLLARLRGLAAVMVPKADGAAGLAVVHEAAGGAVLLPLIETAAGYAALDDVAAAPGVVRLVVGHIDFMADTGLQCSDDEPELAPLRFAVAIATRRHRLAPAVDGVTVQVGDDARLRADTARSLRFGFGAKLCIHPRQVPVVHETLAPSAEQLAWARRVVEADVASGGAAVQLDGRMVDLPVVLQARRTLSREQGISERLRARTVP